MSENTKMALKALSIRQPWAWAIVHALKDIENRTWPTSYRGPVLIHAAKGMTRAEYADVAEFLQEFNPPIALPPFEALDRGGLVGIADITGCVQESPSPWFFGPHGFKLENVRSLPFMPLKGALGFFAVPPEISAAVLEALQ